MTNLNTFSFTDFKNYKKCPMLYYYSKSTNYPKKFILIEDWFEDVMRKIVYYSLFHSDYKLSNLLEKLDNAFKYKENNVINLTQQDLYIVGQKILQNYIKYMDGIIQAKYPFLLKASKYSVGVDNTVFTDFFDVVYNYTGFKIPVVVNFEFNRSKDYIQEHLVLSSIGYSKNYGKALYKAIDFGHDDSLSIYHMKIDPDIIEMKFEELRGIIHGISKNIYFTNYSSSCKIKCPYYNNCYVSHFELEQDKYAI